MTTIERFLLAKGLIEEAGEDVEVIEMKGQPYSLKELLEEYTNYKTDLLEQYPPVVLIFGDEDKLFGIGEKRQSVQKALMDFLPRYKFIMINIQSPVGLVVTNEVEPEEKAKKIREHWLETMSKGGKPIYHDPEVEWKPIVSPVHVHILNVLEMDVDEYEEAMNEIMKILENHG